MLNICNCWSKTELNSAEVYISVGNGFHRCPAAIVSMQELNEKVNRATRNEIEEMTSEI